MVTEVDDGHDQNDKTVKHALMMTMIDDADSRNMRVPMLMLLHSRLQSRAISLRASLLRFVFWGVEV